MTRQEVLAKSVNTSVVTTFLDQAIDHAVASLLARQFEEGYWWGELESNVSITSEHLFLSHILGVADPAQWTKIAAYLQQMQRPDGTWSNWYDGPPDLSTTVEAYVALKMAGLSADSSVMKRTREFIVSQGGVEKARVFTKIWLAMLGEWDWAEIPVVPPELILLPAWFPVSIYSFACWARQTIVALSIVRNAKPAVPLPRWAHIDELFVRGKADAKPAIRPVKVGPRVNAFLGIDRLLRWYDRSLFKPFRRTAIRKAERWILERQEADGSWGGIQPPWVYSLIALHVLGYGSDHPVIRKGLAGFYGKKGFAIEDEKFFRLQSCLSPVWDTALISLALEEADVPSGHPALVRAGEWLLDEQIFVGGDWQVRCKGRPGGWAFEFANDGYPDTDDASVVMMALMPLQLDSARKKRALDRGLGWLLSMQSRGGGWGAFDRNNTQTWPRAIPFADFGEMIDPPSVDVTGHIVEMLGRLGYQKGFPPIDRAVRYLKREQEPDGAWYGRWGVNLIYGLGSVLPALAAIGEDMHAPYVRRAVEWLICHQNADGGWGERVESYQSPKWRGRGPSTASQTAWALLALIAAGEASHFATRRGVGFLIQAQTGDGGWDEPYFTGTGFPLDFMINYHLYRDVFPLMALARYRRAFRGEP